MQVFLLAVVFNHW